MAGLGLAGCGAGGGGAGSAVASGSAADAGAAAGGEGAGASSAEDADDAVARLSDEQVAEYEALIDEQLARQQVQRAGIPEALAAAQEQNPEVCAWLYVPGTNVSVAIARHEGDDTYYMTRDSTGAESVIGAAYMQECDAGDFTDDVTVLYGHAFSDADIVFTGLHDFEDEEFFEQHSRIYVYTPDSVLVYTIASAGTFTDVYLPSLIEEGNANSLQGYLDTFVSPGADGCYERAVDAPVAGQTRMLQLSTCLLPDTDGARYIVSAVLEEETPL